jgi:hypothetical protein
MVFSSPCLQAKFFSHLLAGKGWAALLKASFGEITVLEVLHLPHDCRPRRPDFYVILASLALCCGGNEGRR